MVTETYRRLISGIMTDLAALDASDYAWDASDAWQRARTPGDLAHLRVWPWLVGPIRADRSWYVYTLTLSWPCRYVPDDDALSWARAHASARAVADYLATVSLEGCRVVFRECSQELGDWIACTLRADLYLPR